MSRKERFPRRHRRARRMRQRRMVRPTNGESLLAMLRLVSRRRRHLCQTQASWQYHLATAQPRVAGFLLGLVGVPQCNRRIRASCGILPRHFRVVRSEHLPRLHGSDRSMDFTLHEPSLVAPSFQDRRNRGQVLRIGDWVPIAFDGSRSSAPRTVANEQAFCATNYGKGKTARYRKKKSKGMRRMANEKNKPQPQKPQAWITMLWHMGLRLPWMWRLGPSNSSERAHVMDMLRTGNFPEGSLFCGDAGFVGYPLWSLIMQSGADFLVRVGANVSLLTGNADWRLLKNGIVLCWPKEMMKSNQPPLRLRLVKIRLGKTTAWMLTSVLNPAKLTKKQILMFYKMRWGIEVEFRGLKQTLDRADLRCRNDQRSLAELNWSIMGMAVAELFALKEQLSNKRRRAGKASGAPDPKKRSLARTIRAIRRCIRKSHEVPLPQDNLQSALRDAVTDSYERKASKRQVRSA